MKEILETLFENKQLTREKAKNALIQLTTENHNSAQTAAFMTVYLMRKISCEELAGFRDALIELGTQVDLSDFDPMDLCGTGGDNKNTFNISTLSAFIAAGAGVVIAKHGNNAVSSACGSSNVLGYFGYRFTDNEDVLKAELKKAGICFLHAPLFQPTLKSVANVRKELQFKSFFNMLGPLINPASPQKQVLGVYSEELAEHYSEILGETNKQYSIVHSLDGFDEISLTGTYRIITEESDRLYKPEDSSFIKISEKEILGGRDVKESAKIFLNILEGRGTKAQNEIVVANASLAISCYFPQHSNTDCISIARESLLSKKALNTFKKLLS